MVTLWLGIKQIALFSFLVLVVTEVKEVFKCVIRFVHPFIVVVVISWVTQAFDLILVCINN